MPIESAPPRKPSNQRRASNRRRISTAIGSAGVFARTLTLASAVAIALALVGSAGCGTRVDPKRAAQDSRFEVPQPARAPDDLVITLEFGDQADLDLYVTDPTSETVYFGNAPSRGGAWLDRDARCDAPAPRREVVRVRRPAVGTYRVGVDYNRSCRFRRRPAAYRLVVTTERIRFERTRTAQPLDFDPLALEFEFDPAAGLRPTRQHD